MTEDEFQLLAERECGRRGLLWHHCADSRKCRGLRGFPDLVALGERGLLIAELKSLGGETSPEQELWIWTAHQSGIVIPVLRPRDDLASWLDAII